MSTRVQVILDEQQKARIQQRAARDGLSLSAWIRRAALRELEGQRARGGDEVRALLASMHRRRAVEREPDWEESKALLATGKMAADTGS